MQIVFQVISLATTILTPMMKQLLTYPRDRHPKVQAQHTRGRTTFAKVATIISVFLIESGYQNSLHSKKIVLQ